MDEKNPESVSARRYSIGYVRGWRFSQFLNQVTYRARRRGHEESTQPPFRRQSARLLIRALAYDLFERVRQFHLRGEKVQRSMEWLIKRPIKVGAKIAYHGRSWQVHVASAFSLARYYRAVFGGRHTFKKAVDRETEGVVCSNP